MNKKALITGVTGQDGSYLAELLLEKGYQVYGIQRRASVPNTLRIDHLYGHPDFFTVYGDCTDSLNLWRIINKIRPDEIYNLAAQSHVGISFEQPEFTHNVNALGPLRVLEALRSLNIPAKFYQASSSEIFGNSPPPQNETTRFNPCSPYGVSKLSALETAKTYRESYQTFASNGILFNHESPRRGFNFVTRKITLGFARIQLGLQKTLRLGNLDAKRDWGYAKDYVEAMWKILQHQKPDDFVIATGETHSVREFIEETARYLGIDIKWVGFDTNEHGINLKTGEAIIEVDSIYFRPNEVNALVGDASKARDILGWRPSVSFKKLVELMIEHDLHYVTEEHSMGRTDTSPKKFLI